MKSFGVASIAFFLAACSGPISSYVDHYERAAANDPPFLASRERGGLQGTYMLPRTIFSVEVKVENSATSLQLSKTIEADPRARLLYRLEAGSTSHDQLEVLTDETGLLTSISADTHDKSGEIAVKLAQLVFTTLTKGASGPQPAALPGEVPATTPFKASYDPLNLHEVIPVRRRLAELDYCILVGEETRRAPAEACRQSSALAFGPTESILAPIEYANRFPGIFYRRAIPMPVQVYKRELQSEKQPKRWNLVFSGNEQLFNQADIYQVNINRYAFVRGVTKITFSNGSLSKVSLDKPSEALEFVNIPVQIAKIAFAIPGAAFQRQKELLEAETGVLEAQAKKINAESQLVKLQVQRTGQGVVATPE